MRDDEAWRAVAAAPATSRAAVLAAGPAGALAASWAAPKDAGRAWLAEWRRRLPADARDGDDAATRVIPDSTRPPLAALVRALHAHARTFRVAAASQGWALRGTLRSELVRLLRRSALQPAIAFVHLALCALDFERLRAELLRRVIFPAWKVA
jgi:hypothetical protein